MLETLQKISSTDKVKMSDTRRKSAGKTEEAWLAAMWLGEGTIGIYQHSGRKDKMRTALRSSMGNTDFAIIEQTAQYLENLRIGHFVQTGLRPGSPKWHTRKTITISGFKRNKAFLERIEPFLVGEKRCKAQLALSLIYSRMMKPGGGRQRNGVPYDETELQIVQMLTESFNGNPNEYTPEWIDNIHKIYSELRRQYEETAEMTVRP